MKKVIEVKAIEELIPIINNWMFLFFISDGVENRKRIISDYYEFLNDSRLRDFIVPGYCMLAGKISGSKKYPEEELITTSNIVKIRKEGWPKYPSEYLHDGKFDIMSVITESGNTYYVRLSKESAAQFELMNAWQMRKVICNIPCAYVPRNIAEMIPHLL